MWRFKFALTRINDTEVVSRSYPTREKAEEIRELMRNLNIGCLNIFKAIGESSIEKEKQEKKEKYLEGTISQFKKYFQAEMNVIEKHGSVIDSYLLLDTLIQRLEKIIIKGLEFILDPEPINTNQIPLPLATEIYQDDIIYLLAIVEILRDKADDYSFTHGSYWETVIEKLNNLVKEIESGDIKKKFKKEQPAA